MNGRVRRCYWFVGSLKCGICMYGAGRNAGIIYGVDVSTDNTVPVRLNFNIID